MNYIFGTSIAAQRLEKMLDKQPIARRKISTVFSQFTNKMFTIINTKDPETIRLCWALLKEHTLKRIDCKKGLSDDIRTYTKNVIMYRYRFFLHNFNNIVRLHKIYKLDFKTRTDILP